MERQCRLIKPAIVNGVHCRPGHVFTLGNRYRVVPKGSLLSVLDTADESAAKEFANSIEAEVEVYPDPGPCETIIDQHDRVDVNNDNARIVGTTKIVPLYVLITNPENSEPKKANIFNKFFSKK